MTNFNEINTNLLTQKIKLILFNLNLNEKYAAFDYLTLILIYFLRNDPSLKCFNKAIQEISKQHNITRRTIMQELNNLVKHIDSSQIHNLSFNLVKNHTINKIRAIKNYIEQNIDF
ncbi:MAG: hypothetical protein J6Q13_03250 [Clostridia bacterium]|nr:hypothetical protein [Clostridia bacterium]